MCLCACVLVYVEVFLLSAVQLIVHESGTHYMIENQKQLKIHGAKRQISLPETLETWLIGGQIVQR